MSFFKEKIHFKKIVKKNVRFFFKKFSEIVLTLFSIKLYLSRNKNYFYVIICAILILH